ncbi:hypothetical protein Fmac_008476 [Flemingia macrophylla]|uniref:Uncharacterized protein n=1 Tax=Flemingia macrophylla TaxID=520843 RepID=A0ABD1MXI6_9FABA
MILDLPNKLIFNKELLPRKSTIDNPITTLGLVSLLDLRLTDELSCVTSENKIRPCTFVHELENGEHLIIESQKEEHVKEGNANRKQQVPSFTVMIRLILTMVWRNLTRNPNSYASVGATAPPSPTPGSSSHPLGTRLAPSNPPTPGRRRNNTAARATQQPPPGHATHLCPPPPGGSQPPPPPFCPDAEQQLHPRRDAPATPPKTPPSGATLLPVKQTVPSPTLLTRSWDHKQRTEEKQKSDKDLLSATKALLAHLDKEILTKTKRKV